MFKLFATHHNKIQFFGYEVANIVWILHQSLNGAPTGLRLEFVGNNLTSRKRP